MKFRDYLKDKYLEIIISLITLFLLTLMFVAFKMNISFIIASLFVILSLLIFIFLYNFLKKKFFYNNFINNLNNLDQKYLITETITSPNFKEGKILCDALYEIDKSMKEKINSYKLSIDDFQDYLEMWIHEVKIPLANLILINHNSGKKNKKIEKETKKIENYVEQILYYARSENAEKDYLIKKYDLKTIVNKVVLKNKDAFIYNKINLKISDFDYTILTDSKWLEFIINQIINNSLKYKSENSVIEINAKKENNKTILEIYDNGIGIKQSDISKVFDKSFTGYNGRKSASTGMGLYICRKLCDKLGHQIKIKSEENKYTCVSIVFNENEFYNVLN